MTEFQIIIGSPLDFEELVAYVWINGEQICLVQKEDGINEMKVEFFNEPIETKIPLITLLDALKKAKEELLK